MTALECLRAMREAMRGPDERSLVEAFDYAARGILINAEREELHAEVMVLLGLAGLPNLLQLVDRAIDFAELVEIRGKTPPASCEWCKGHGKVGIEFDGALHAAKCSQCKGTGRFLEVER